MRPAGVVSSIGGSFCHAGAESAEADSAETFDTAAGQPTSDEPMPPQAADNGFVADVGGQTVTSGPAEAEPPALALASSDAFSGAALGGSYETAAAASVSNVQLVAEPVPAHASAGESQVWFDALCLGSKHVPSMCSALRSLFDSGRFRGKVMYATQCGQSVQEQPAAEDSHNGADAANDLATIPLGGNTPASPSAASAASEPGSDEDWTVVEVDLPVLTLQGIRGHTVNVNCLRLMFDTSCHSVLLAEGGHANT